MITIKLTDENIPDIEKLFFTLALSENAAERQTASQIGAVLHSYSREKFKIQWFKLSNQEQNEWMERAKKCQKKTAS